MTAITKDEVLNLLDVSELESRKVAILSFITDEENDFEYRLEVWLKTPRQLYDVGSYCVNLPTYEKQYGEISWYDDFYADRYSEVDLRECYKKLLEEEEDQEKANAFANETMALGEFTFIYDW